MKMVISSHTQQVRIGGTGVGGVVIAPGSSSCTVGGVQYSKCIANIPTCTGFTPVAGQVPVLSTSSTPNPCWSAAGGINLYVNGTLVASGLTGVTVNGH